MFRISQNKRLNLNYNIGKSDDPAELSDGGKL